MANTIAVSTISMVVIDTVSEAKASRGLAERQPAAEQRSDGQRVPEEEGEHDRQHHGRQVMPAERSRDDHAQDLADRAAGQAMDRCGQGQLVCRSVLVVHLSDASGVVKSLT